VVYSREDTHVVYSREGYPREVRQQERLTHVRLDSRRG